jgi:hypothetical protein
MSVIRNRLNSKFQTLLEETTDVSWKDPNSSDYDRQWAEDALFHTIGPLTDEPLWVDHPKKKGGRAYKVDAKGNKLPAWTSPSEPVPGFTPGGPAPRWTQNELVMAFAGDPGMLFAGRKDNPRSPEYGNKGGSPMYRTARKVARIYNRTNDRQLIADFFQNGFIPLMQMMQPGYDQSRSPFISYAIRNIVSAMEHGVGGLGNKQAIAAKGELSEQGIVGLKGLLEKDNPEEIRAIADNQVKGKYREQSLHDKNDDNPFGIYSPALYALAHQYADALETGDEANIEAVREQINQQIGKINDENVKILGASTGIGQAISTADRKTSIDVGSMDAPGIGNEEEGGMAGNIAASEMEEAITDPETVYLILDMAINTDLNAAVGHLPKYQQMAKDFESKGDKIGGEMGANELRYVIRTLGEIGANYPGKGTVRANTDIPRDSRGWWEKGSDPEIEPIPRAPKGTLWHSLWKRKKYQSMGPTEISQEMTNELSEFEKLGIPTARILRTKQKKGKVPKIDPVTGEVERDPETGEEIKVQGVVSEWQEAVSKTAVSNTLRSATVKLRFIAHLERDSLGLDKQKIEKKENPNAAPTPDAPAAEAEPEASPLTSRQRWAQGFLDKAFAQESKNKPNHPLLEDIANTDALDRELIAEACDWVCARIERAITEEAPPGWKKTVEHMKDEGMTDEEAFSRAWATSKKGGSKPDERKKNAHYAKESKMKPVDSLALEDYVPAVGLEGFLEQTVADLVKTGIDETDACLQIVRLLVSEFGSRTKPGFITNQRQLLSFVGKVLMDMMNWAGIDGEEAKKHIIQAITDGLRTGDSLGKIEGVPMYSESKKPKLG